MLHTIPRCYRFIIVRVFEINNDMTITW